MKMIKNKIEKMKKTEEQPKEITKDDFLKNVVYVGVQGKENLDKALDSLSKVFPEKHIYIMDKQMFSKVGFMFVEQHLKWKEQQKLETFVNDPAKMQDAMIVMMKIVQKLGENKWFYLKDVVSETNMTYPQAQSTLDLLFAFGMAAYRRDPIAVNRNQWRIIKDEEAKLKYVDELASGLKEEAKQLRAAASEIKKQILGNKPIKVNATVNKTPKNPPKKTK